MLRPYTSKSTFAHRSIELKLYEGENAVLALTSVPFQIALPDIYDKVEFESEESK